MTEANTGLYRRQFLVFLAATGFVVLLAIVVTFNNARLARAAAEETLAYNHGRHVAAGIECIYCHPGVLTGAVAGIPSTAKCMGCHQNVQVREEAQEDIQILFDHWESGQPLRWRKTFDQPDFVYYSHQPHIAAGRACEECHGNVAEMAYLEQTIRLNMGFCLACHRQPDSGNAPRIVQAAAGGAWRLIHQPEDTDRVVRLESCSTCHQ